MRLFEFTDQPWLPSIFRNYVLELLQWQLTTYEIYTPLVTKLKDVLQQIDCHQIVDICSGGGGPILQIQEILEREEGYPVSVTLSDKFPNPEALRNLNLKLKPKIDYFSDPVDATSIPNHLTGFHTFFTCFHHFDPTAAVQILRDVTAKRAPIGIFEFTERKRSNLFGMLLSPLAVFCQTPRIESFRLGRFFWTYVIPIIPLIYWWDGTVSHLRTYTLTELKNMVGAVNAPAYHWEIGKISSLETTDSITFLIGVPTAAR